MRRWWADRQWRRSVYTWERQQYPRLPRLRRLWAEHVALSAAILCAGLVIGVATQAPVPNRSVPTRLVYPIPERDTWPAGVVAFRDSGSPDGLPPADMLVGLNLPPVTFPTWGQ